MLNPKSRHHDNNGQSATQSWLRWHSAQQLSAHRAPASDDSLIQFEDFSERLRLKAIYNLQMVTLSNLSHTRTPSGSQNQTEVTTTQLADSLFVSKL